MFEETVFQTEIRAALESAAAPPVDLRAIYGRAPLTRRPEFPSGRIAAVTAAALVAALLFMPQAQAVVQSMETRVEAALRLMGIHSGPPVPDSIVGALQAGTHKAGLAQAAKQVRFTLVEPQGLPSGIRSEKIYVSPTARWNQSKKWHVAEKIVTFEYTRANGEQFMLQAAPYVPAETIYAYMWQTVEKPNGDPVIVNGRLKLIRHDSLHWRNGNQVTNAITGPGLSLDEARAIERAMRGQDLPGVKTGKPRGGGRFMVVKP
ncbi:MAG TPA: hypothetical protein VFL13_12990 [Candidatus Baltobacteraceae bacterium]|nr:hypothetical protein [Candidatus Baltobacteraceae bacterium]